jgi:hypothetical protein
MSHIVRGGTNRKPEGHPFCPRLAEESDAKAVVCGTERLRKNLRSRMNKPKPIQRNRSKGWKMPANAI